MHDYNGDGRSNSHDSAIFHNVINSSGGGGGSSGGSSGGGCGCGTAGIVIFLLLIIEIIKSGLLSGAFAGLILVICLGALFLIFACWLESL